MSKVNILKNALGYYISLKTPKLGYKKVADPKLPYKDKFYELEILPIFEELKALKKKYKKSDVKSLQTTKEYTKEEFIKRFKVEPPTDTKYVNDDGEYETLKVRKKADYPDGQPSPFRPEVVGFASLGNQSKNGFEINHEVLMSNGTEFNVKLIEKYFDKHGTTSLQLDKVQVVNLIPYVVEDFDDAGEDTEAKVAKSTASKAEEEDEDFEDAGESGISNEETPEDDEDWEE